MVADRPEDLGAHAYCFMSMSMVLIIMDVIPGHRRLKAIFILRQRLSLTDVPE